jgi:excisionase family DNA binding protein
MATDSHHAHLHTPADRELLDVEQAAVHLGTPVRFIRRLIAERRIRFYKVGRYVRLDRQDLDVFIAEGAVEAWGMRPGRR